MVAEAKRKMEEEQAAKAYAEFLDAFDADDNAPARRSAKSSTFVRSSRDSGAAYAPSGAISVGCAFPFHACTFSRPSKVCCPITERGHPYMTAVSVSSSCTEAERQTRHGCLLRRDQEVRPELQQYSCSSYLSQCCEGIRQTERLGFLGTVSSQCGFSSPMLIFPAKPTHGLQPLWQVSFRLFITAWKIHIVFQPMKDRVEAKTEVTRG